jgi:hypothetical protein
LILQRPQILFVQEERVRRKTKETEKNGWGPTRERLLIRAILAGAERIKEQRRKIGDFIRLIELRKLVVRQEPRLVIAYWVPA